MQTFFSSSLGYQQVFEVNHSIDYPLPDMVPFDKYYFFASVFAIDKRTNGSVPVVTFAAGDAAENIVLSSIDLNTTSTFTYGSGTEQESVEVESRVIQIEAKRSQLAKAFTICLFFINWALAIVSMNITLLVLKKKKVDTAILALPVTIVITIPTLRGLYIGSPPFGVYIGKFLALDLSPGTDATLRHIRILLADDGSCGLLHGSLVHEPQAWR